MMRYQPRGLAPSGRRWAPRTIKLGSTLTHSLAEATDEMVRLKAQVLAGEDPAEDRRAAARRRREAASAAQATLTCGEALDAYERLLAARGLSAKHFRDELGHTRRALASVNLLDAPPTSVTTMSLEAILARSPAGSRYARYNALHRFMVWALRNEGSGAVSPTLLLSRHEKPKAVAPRARVLNAAELAALWHAAGAHPVPVSSDVMQFLIAVPCRESEAGKMRWRDVDMASAVWEMPTSKNRSPHRFSLSARALEIVRRRRRAAGGVTQPDRLVFPAPRSDGRRPYRSWWGPKGFIDKHSGVTGWRIHDFRRTFATHLAEAGFDDGVIDLSLNHRASGSRSRVTRTYNLSLRWGERVRLMHAWNAFIDAAIGGAGASDQTADILRSWPQALELPGTANRAGTTTAVS
jgi:integrase